MGTNNPYLPDNVLSDEGAIKYLAQMVFALMNQTYTAKTGDPITLTATEMVAGVVNVSGGTTATVNTATGAAIIARMVALDANAGVGSTARFTVINGNSGTMTVAAGDGNVTLVGAGATTVLTTVVREYLIKILTATTVSLTVVG